MMGDYTYLAGLVVLGAIIAAIGFVFGHKERKAQHQAEHGHGSAVLPGP
jgi:hypothetical protein